eukprot:5622604-Pleurochrysis_carterae.AAC.1
MVCWNTTVNGISLAGSTVRARDCEYNDDFVADDSDNVHAGAAPNETGGDKVGNDTADVEQKENQEVEEANAVAALASSMKKSMQTHGLHCGKATSSFLKAWYAAILQRSVLESHVMYEAFEVFQEACYVSDEGIPNPIGELQEHDYVRCVDSGYLF